MEFNVNNKVKVKVTEFGEQVLRKRHEEVNKHFLESSEFQLEKDGEGFTEFQLWELMSIFGEHLYNGAEVPFETTIKIP